MLYAALIELLDALLLLYAAFKELLLRFDSVLKLLSARFSPARFFRFRGSAARENDTSEHSQCQHPFKISLKKGAKNIAQPSFTLWLSTV